MIPLYYHDLHLLYRHPEASDRPSFSAIVDYLSKSDSSLTACQEKDQGNPPDAYILGKPLGAGSSLYHDLQEAYLSTKTTAGDYEVPSGSR